MHLLATSSASLDDLVEPVDLRQLPGDIVILSFADTDLSGLATAWNAERDVLPSVRLANLRDLRHPMLWRGPGSTERDHVARHRRGAGRGAGDDGPVLEAVEDRVGEERPADRR